MTQSAVRLRGVTKVFDDVVAVDDVDLDIPAGEFFAMLGPSGSGKTTMLRLIAGFELPTDGTIELDGRDVSDDPPFDRDVNTVFQDYALFPHMDVARNVEYGLRVKKVPKAERASPGARRRWRASGSRRSGRRASPTSSPVASASGSPSPVRWSTDRRCSCSTSRSAPSTSSSASRCRWS